MTAQVLKSSRKKYILYILSSTLLDVREEDGKNQKQ
jgi:hypothetical protein